jgi:hypothetical protein
MQVREELTGPHVDDFARRLQHVTQTAVDRLGIPIVVAQQHVVRMLINPKRYADSREFLGSAMCRIPADDFAPFGRPIGLFGVKLIFPAGEPGGDVHTLRIESFNQDPRCVFIEDVATFTTPLMPGQWGKIADNVHATYAFLREKVLAFLARYDAPAGE